MAIPARQATHAAGRAVPGVIVPPGVDGERFHPLDDRRAFATRASGSASIPIAPLVLGLSRLVPRKGFDIVIDAVAELPGVQLAIGGTGRDAARLQRRARGNPDVHFLGRVAEADLPRVYGCADVFAMCCRDRWAGLEAEGFGIVFLEAAACAVPAVAGRSGGAHEAVADCETGFVVEPRDVAAVRAAIGATVRRPRAARARWAGRRGPGPTTTILRASRRPAAPDHPGRLLGNFPASPTESVCPVD